MFLLYFTLYVQYLFYRSGERLEISIQSKELLFYPAQVTVTIVGGQSVCCLSVCLSVCSRTVLISGVTHVTDLLGFILCRPTLI